jgi:hypothetical protein
MEKDILTMLSQHIANPQSREVALDISQRLNSAITAYEDKLIKDCAKAIVEERLRGSTANPLMKIIKDAGKEERKVYTTWWATASLDDKKDIKDNLKNIHKAMTKKWIEKYEYVIEQRGETEEEAGKGIHVHYIITGKKAPSQILRELASTLKIDQSFIKLKPANNIDGLRSYMTGQKTPEKLKKVEIDKIFREKHNIETYYTGGQ